MAETREQFSARTRKESQECGCHDVTDQPRRVHFVVNRCTSCPFLNHVDQDMEVPTHDASFAAGWYCLHPKIRLVAGDPIATHKMVEDSPPHVVGLNSWLKHHERALFPHTCPLPKPDVVEEPVGVRLLDVG